MEMIYLMAPIYPIDLYRWDLTESPLTLNVAMIAFALLTPRTLVAMPPLLIKRSNKTALKTKPNDV